MVGTSCRGALFCFMVGTFFAFLTFIEEKFKDIQLWRKIEGRFPGYRCADTIIEV